LNWTAASSATSYNVKRSTTNGGPYANVQTGVTGTTFTNTGLTNGTPYYYVVTAVNASGESPISTQVSATPAATGGDTGGVTVTKAVTSASPWFNEIQVRLANTSTITAMTVTIVVSGPRAWHSAACTTRGWTDYAEQCEHYLGCDVHLDASRWPDAERRHHANLRGADGW
jgi:fibronectin type 3 domain-containing protein